MCSGSSTLAVLIKAPHHEQMMLNVGCFERSRWLLRGSIRLLKVTFLTDPISDTKKCANKFRSQLKLHARPNDSYRTSPEHRHTSIRHSQKRISLQTTKRSSHENRSRSY